MKTRILNDGAAATSGADPIKLFSSFSFFSLVRSFYKQLFFVCNKCKSLPAKNGKNLR